MAVLDAVEWESPLLQPVENAAAERMLRKELTAVPYGIRYFLDSPWLTRAMVLLDGAHVPLRYVTPELSEMIALVVSQDNACRYCYAATRTALTILGFSEARIRRLEEELVGADLPVAERRALELARAVSRASPVASAREAEPVLSAGLPLRAVQEVALLAAVNVFFNRCTTIAALPPMPPPDDGWLEIARRALGAGRLWMRHVGPVEPLGADERTGPFAPLVVALDGVPAARRLREVLDVAFGATALGPRVRALVLAVIARGLGCTACESETTRLLRAEGMTDGEVQHVLAHLSGPGLSAQEIAAMELARESIRYRPVHIQRRARDVRALFSREELVDLIGFLALGNMLGRLAIVADLAGSRP